jgi:hypothetical protein
MAKQEEKVRVLAKTLAQFVLIFSPGVPLTFRTASVQKYNASDPCRFFFGIFLIGGVRTSRGLGRVNFNSRRSEH